MAIQFCSDCGDLLPITKFFTVKCECCGRRHKNAILGLRTTSSTNNFPSELRRNRGVIQALPALSSIDTWASTQADCPKCGAAEARYSTLQLRGADEGTTVFYSCTKCPHRWNENN